MPQAFPADSQQFEADQQPIRVVEVWDTPFTPLRNDQASGGIQVTMREPRRSDGAFSMLADLSAASASTAATAFNGATATTVIDQGRTPNLVGYWAGGAPGYHGASWVGRVAYRFEGWVRPGSGRDWFDPSTTFTATVACAGNGYFRVIKNGTTDLINGSMTEKSYLQDDSGGPMMSAATSFTTGDKLDVYYVQDGTTWGGFTFKMIPGTVPDTIADRQLAMRTGALLGCGLIDDQGATTPVNVTKRTLSLIGNIDVNQTLGQTTTASIQVPLANTQNWDGIGWEWVRNIAVLAEGNPTAGTTTTLTTTGLTAGALVGKTLQILGGPNAGLTRTITANTTTLITVGVAFPTSLTTTSVFLVESAQPDAAGFLRLHDFEPDGGGVKVKTIDLKRQRLIRIKGGFKRWDTTDELYTLFTGFIDDFTDVASGQVTITCRGVEQRLVDQFMKNYPDKISYMTYGYQKLAGTSQPVWPVPAYDNWPMEYVLRDLLTRAGIDESRTRAPLLAPQADGSSVAVVM